MPLSLSGTTGIVTGNIASNAVTTSQILNANVTPAKLSQPMTLATAQNATGTAIDFTGIPSWAKRITVMFRAVSTNGSSAPQIQLGTASAVENTGYTGSNSIAIEGALTAAQLFTTGFGVGVNSSNWAASVVFSGSIIINSLGSNSWSAQGVVGASDVARIYTTAGAKTLSGTLDRVRITTVNGTDTFDGGDINIMYE